MAINIQNNYMYRYQCGNLQSGNGNVKLNKPSFTGAGDIQRLTHMNIGMMGEGFIGHVLLKNATKGTDEFVNVFKRFDCGNERYYLKNNNDELIGEFLAKIKKYFNYDKFMYKEDPSHVLVDDLFNYSNPKTPFYKKGLDYYKGVGIRLLQIAQRRSDEAQCVGNIRLNAMPEARRFYTDKIGMIQDPNHPYSGMLIIPPDKKEPLSKMYGGL